MHELPSKVTSSSEASKMEAHRLDEVISEVEVFGRDIETKNETYEVESADRLLQALRRLKRKCGIERMGRITVDLD
jgi:hypothetical protein